MSDDGKYVTSCPTCQQKVRIPMGHSGKVKCPNCSFTWQPQTNATNFYVQEPKMKFAMTLGDTIDYGLSMIPAVVMTILISGAIGWGGFAIIANSPNAHEPAIALCFGVFLLAVSSITFTSLTYGIGVKVVAEGVMVGNLAADEYRNSEENLTIPNPVVTDDNKQLVSIPQEPITETLPDGAEIYFES